MGSDLYMEAQNFRPKRNVYWDGLDLVVEIEEFYTYDMKERYRGPVNDQTRPLLFALGIVIPERPEQKEYDI